MADSLHESPASAGLFFFRNGCAFGLFLLDRAPKRPLFVTIDPAMH